jgi:transcriptional regulator with XRE-family HTH domain
MDAASLVRAARVRRGLTQAELARRVGTSQPVISAYENGARDPSTATLARLVAGTGEALVLGLADRATDLPPLASPEARSAAVVDVLLLADAIPRRRPAERCPALPRMDSTSRG